MMDQSTKEGARELKRRALRWQKHKLPRKSRMPASQRLLAWLMLILSIAMALVLLAGK